MKMINLIMKILLYLIIKYQLNLVNNIEVEKNEMSDKSFQIIYFI